MNTAQAVMQEAVDTVERNMRAVEVLTGRSLPTAPGEIVIEDGVPMPRRRSGRPSKRYPFEQMEVGQSFFVPAAGRKNLAIVSPYNKLLAPKRFVYRAWVQDGTSGFRVWRTA